MRKNLKNKKILITYGPTWIALDEMRIISNKSSGALGRALALNFAQKGAKVTVLQGPVTERLESKQIKIINFTYFDELLKALRAELKKSYDIVIHAAAVSDYQLQKPFKGKIDSHIKNLRLNLIPTEKIINKIKEWNPEVFLVGFKLESNLNKINTKIRSLLTQAHCDLIVANSLKSGYQAMILNRQSKVMARANSKNILVQYLTKLLTI